MDLIVLDICLLANIFVIQLSKEFLLTLHNRASLSSSEQFQSQLYDWRRTLWAKAAVKEEYRLIIWTLNLNALYMNMNCMCIYNLK